jgi:hypothetical protein
VTPAVHDLLERAATYRALSLALAPPGPGLATELLGLSRECAPVAREGVARLAEEARGDLDGRYHTLLGFAGACRDAETDCDLRGVSAKGTMLGDVAAFYRAFAFEPTAEPAVPADHVSRELAFLGYLAVKQALALDAGEEDNASVCAEAHRTFVRDHLGRWARRFFARLAAAAEDGFYVHAAALADDVLLALEPEGLAEPRATADVPLPVVQPDECDGGLLH